MTCTHEHICRYTTGFHCEDCHKFFDKSSPEYRGGGEMLSGIWMTLNNIGVDLYRAGKPKDPEVEAMMEKIGIGERHENYEEIISEAEVVMSKYGKTEDSSSMPLKG